VSLDFDINYRAKNQSLAAATAAASWDTAPGGGVLGTAGLPAALDAGNLMGAAWRIHLNGAAAADRAFIITRFVPSIAGL
jgi:hypothetical protein